MFPRLEIVARLTPGGLPNAVSFLGPDGRNYVLYYRFSNNARGPLRFATQWTPVSFVPNFPE